MRLRNWILAPMLMAALAAITFAAPLISMRAVRQMTNAEAALSPFVAFEGSVVFFNAANLDLYLQDGSDGIYVRATEGLNLAPGDRVQVEGRMLPSWKPYLSATHVQVLRHGSLPPAQPVSFSDLTHSQIVGIRVLVRGLVRTADLDTSGVLPAGHMHLAMDGGFADLEIPSKDLHAMRALIDSEVEVVGAVGRKFDAKMQPTGIRIRLLALNDVHLLHAASADPWALPTTPLGDIFSGYRINTLSNRLRVRGILTYYEPGRAAVVQNGPQSLWINTDATDQLALGDEVDAIGFPNSDEGRLMLEHSELRGTGVHQSLSPFVATVEQLTKWPRNSAEGHGFDLVSVYARVISQVRTDHEDRFVLESSGSIFSAVFHHPVSSSSIPAFPRVTPGSEVRATGICWIADGTPVNGQVPFDILLRSPEDVAVVAPPPLWSSHNLSVALVILLLFLLALGTRSLFVERQARNRTAAAAEIERLRRRILEDINAMRPLADIVEQVTQVVSLQLDGAPCWCSISGGATLGNRPDSQQERHIIDHHIPARTGGLLGVMHVALPLTKPHGDLQEALSLGAGLVAVAIETRRLYTDLLHRSEFDQLTGLYNRSALDDKIEEQIQSARAQGSIFAILYMDFNDFKQINDTYGHHTGDLFLEEAARRMKSQLRPCDLLARLGGDEFTAILTNVRSREEVEEVATRLNRALAEPFFLGTVCLPGSASIGISLYPEDGTTQDALLKSADSAMYADKAIRKRRQ